MLSITEKKIRNGRIPNKNRKMRQIGTSDVEQEEQINYISIYEM